MKLQPWVRVFVVFALLTLPISGAWAQTNFWWTNTVDGVWSGANWTNETGIGGGPAGGSNDYTISFLNAGATYNSTNDLTSFTLNRLIFSNAGVTLWGSDLVFSLASNGTTFPQLLQNGASNVIIQTAVIFTNTTTVGGSGSGRVTINGNISGPGGLIKSGNHTLTLVGSNTFIGATTLNDGVLLLQNNNALSGTSGITANGGVLQLGNGITISNKSITISNANPGLGNSCGSLQATNGAATWAGAVTLGVNSVRVGAQAGTLTISGPIDSGTNVFDLYIRSLNSTDTVILSSTNNTYKGGTYAFVGNLKAGAANVTPTGSALVMGNAAGFSASVDLAGFNQQVAGVANFPGQSGTILITNSQPAQPVVFTISNETTTAYSGSVGGNLALVKLGNGTQTLSGANNYTGDTTIGTGTLQIGAGGTTGTIGTGIITNNATLVFNRSNTYTVTNAITGTGTLVQSGIGLLALTGTNTYTGATTINAGALLFGTADALPSTSLIVINPGGALAVTNAAAPFTAVSTWLTSGRVSSNTAGAIALAYNTAEDIDFTVASNSYTNFSLGAVGSVNYTGTNFLFANATYQLGGGGGTLTIVSNNVLTGANRLVAFGNGAVGTVVFTATNNYTGGTVINSNGTLQTPIIGLGSGAVTNFGSLILNQATTGPWTNVISGTGSVTVQGGGAITFTGNNTYTGLTTLGNTTTLILSNTTGNPAISGPIQVGVSGNSFLVMGANQQFVPTALITFGGTATYGRFILNGSIQAIAGLSDPGGHGIVENTDAAQSVNTGPATLIISNTANYTHAGYLRNALNDGPSNTLAVIKDGSGTQTLSGGNIKYTGGTTIRAGVLALNNTPNFTGLTTITGGQLQLLTANAAQNSTISNLVVNGLNFSANTNAYTLGGLAGSVNLPLTNAAGAAVALTVGNNNSTTLYGGVLSGPGSLTKNGSGALTLTGTNTYTGNTTITGGLLQADFGVGLPSSSNITLNGGTWATLGGSITNALGTSAAQINIIAGSTSGFTALNTPLTVSLFGSSTTLVWGATIFSPAALVLNDSPANQTLTFQNNLDLNGTNRTIAVRAAAAILTGSITNSSVAPAGLTKTGAGTLVLANANTYTGLTILDNTAAGGMLVLSNTTGTGLAIAGDIQLGSGAGNSVFLRLGANEQIADTALLSFTSAVVNARFLLGGYNETIGGLTDPNGIGVVENNDNFPSFTNAGPSILTLNVSTATNYVFAGYVRNYFTGGGTGPSNTVTLIKTGTGTQTFAGANIGNGGLAGVTVQAGTLALSNTTSFAAPVTVTGGQLLLWTSTDAQGSAISNLAVNGVAFGPNTNAYTIANLAGTGDITLTNAGGLGVVLTLGANNSNTLYAGNLSDNALTGSVIKAGAGALTLAGTNTFIGGTTINAGLIQFTGNNALPASGLVLVNAGAIAALDFTGVSARLAQINTTSAGLIAVTPASAGESVNFATASLSNAYFGAHGTVLYGGTFTPFTNTYRFGATAGSTFIFTNLIAGATNVLVGGFPGTVVLTASNTFTGTTTINAGTLQLSNGNNRLPATTVLNFGGSAVLDIGANSQTLANLTVANNTTGTVTGVDGTLVVKGSSDFKIGGSVINGTALLNLTGLSTFVYTNPANTFTVGGTPVPADGKVILALSNSITAVAVTVGGAALQAGTGVNTGTLLFGQLNTINANVITAAVSKTSGTMTFQTGLTNNPTLTIRATDGSSRVSNFIVGYNNSSTGGNVGSGLVDLTNNVAGSSLLDARVSNMVIGVAAAASTANGAFLMGGGTLDVLTNIIGQTTAGAGPATGLFSVNGGTVINSVLTLGARAGGAVTATFNLNTNSTLRAQTIQAGAGTGTRAFNWNSGTIANYASGATTNDLTISGVNLTLDPAGVHTFAIDAGRTGIVNSALTESAAGASLVKDGLGTLLLNGTNTYTGQTTIGDGTLGGNGVIAGTVAINNGATLSPGASVGTLTVGNLTLTNGVKLVFELGATNASDKVIVNNMLSLEGMNTNWFVLSAVGGFGAGEYTLFDAAGITGSLGSGTNFDNIGGYTGYLWLDTGANDVKLTVVPEPGAGTLVAAGLLGMLLVRRRRH